jgi:hypothetical protein
MNDCLNCKDEEGGICFECRLMAEQNKMLMNPFTGSMDTAENWLSDYTHAKTRGFPEELLWNEDDFSSLIEVKWDDETENWIGVK